MFSSKAVQALMDKEDITQVVIESITGLDLPQVFVDEFANEITELGNNTHRNQVDQDNESLNVKPKAKKRRGYQPRERIERTQKEESCWYRRYLAADKRNSVISGECAIDSTAADKKLASQFKTTFRVYWTVFEEIKQTIIAKHFHDPNKKDAVGFSHDVELLVLGLLYYVG